MATFRRLSALGVGLASGALILSACSGSSSSETAISSPYVDVTKQATTDLETVKWNLMGEPPSLDPLGPSLDMVQQVLPNLCEGLLKQAPGAKIEDSLASLAKPDDTTRVFTLKDGVAFSNGAPVTTDDVVYSLKRSLDPDTQSFFATQFVNVKSVKATGDKDVTVTLTRPDAFFDAAMATYASVVVNKEATEKAGKKAFSLDSPPVCTGPYTVGAWKPGQSLTLTRNDNYWNDSAKLRTKNIQFTFLSDDASVGSAIAGGEIDGMYGVPFGVVPRVKSAGTGELFRGESNQSVQLVFTGANSSALKDKRLRDALRMAIDYQGIQTKILHFSKYVPVKAPVGSANWGYAADAFQQAWDALPEPTTDLTAAKKMVDEVVADSGPLEESLFVYNSSMDYLSRIAVSIQDAAKTIGIPIKLRGLPTADFIPQLVDPKARATFELTLIQNDLTSPEPALKYSDMYTPGAFFNFSDTTDPKIASLLTKAQSTADEAARAALVVDAQTLIMENPYFVPLGEANNLLYLKKGITGVSPSTTHVFFPWVEDLGGE